MPKTETIVQKFRNYLPLFVQIIGILVVIANLWLVSKLAPLDKSLVIMAERIDDIKDKVDNVERQHDVFVQKDTFNSVVERVNHISSRVDQIYSIVAGR